MVMPLLSARSLRIPRHRGLQCKAQLNTAVETTAGNTLFHLVVEDDHVAVRVSSPVSAFRSKKLCVARA